MMTQMQETMRRMEQVQQRTHQATQATQQQLRTRAQVSEQERLMLRAYESLDENARQLHALAQRSQDMIRSRDFQRDREMQRDMDRLRQHMEGMATQMEATLQTMERLRLRLNTGTP